MIIVHESLAVVIFITLIFGIDDLGYFVADFRLFSSFIAATSFVILIITTKIFFISLALTLHYVLMCQLRLYVSITCLQAD